MAVEAVKEVQTSAGLVSSFCDTIWITIMRTSHVLIPVGNGCLNGICVLDTIQVYVPCKDVHTLIKSP